MAALTGEKEKPESFSSSSSLSLNAIQVRASCNSKDFCACFVKASLSRRQPNKPSVLPGPLTPAGGPWTRRRVLEGGRGKGEKERGRKGLSVVKREKEKRR